MERLDRIFREASLRAVIFSREHLGVRLDFTEESLECLDNILELFHKVNDSQEFNEDRLLDLSMTFGGYLGEVILKNIGGAWEENEEKFIFFSVYEKKVLPLNIIYKRINIGERASVKEWYSNLKEKYAS